MAIIADASSCGTLVDDRPKVKCKAPAMLRAYKERWKQEQGQAAPELDPVLASAIQVRAILEGISQRCYKGETWAPDLECDVWDAIYNGVYSVAYGEITSEEAQKLRTLAGKMNGWLFWNAELNEVNYINTEEWLKMYGRRYLEAEE
jgi:hypothetical protein